MRFWAAYPSCGCVASALDFCSIWFQPPKFDKDEVKREESLTIKRDRKVTLCELSKKMKLKTLSKNNAVTGHYRQKESQIRDSCTRSGFEDGGTASKSCTVTLRDIF